MAQIETYVFFLIKNKKKKEYLIIKCIPVLFLLQVLLTSFCETMDFSWFWKINFVTRSLAWFALGYYIHSIPDERIKRINEKKVVLVAIMGLAIVLIPVVFNLKLKFSSLGYVFYATALFLIALKYGERSICKPIEYLGDNLSLWVYIFHVPTSSVVKMIVKRLINIDTESGIYVLIHPIITLCVVIIISYIFNVLLLKIQKKR